LKDTCALAIRVPAPPLAVTFLIVNLPVESTIQVGRRKHKRTTLPSRKSGSRRKR